MADVYTALPVGLVNTGKVSEKFTHNVDICFLVSFTIIFILTAFCGT